MTSSWLLTIPFFLGATWDDNCLKLPVVKIEEMMTKRRKREEDFMEDVFGESVYIVTYISEYWFL